MSETTMDPLWIQITVARRRNRLAERNRLATPPITKKTKPFFLLNICSQLSTILQLPSLIQLCIQLQVINIHYINWVVLTLSKLVRLSISYKTSRHTFNVATNTWEQSQSSGSGKEKIGVGRSQRAHFFAHSSRQRWYHGCHEEFGYPGYTHSN